MHVIIFGDGDGDEAKALLFHSKEAIKWKDEIGNKYANLPPRRNRLAGFTISGQSIAEAVHEYLTRAVDAGGTPTRLLTGIIELGWDAGRQREDQQLQASDICALIKTDLEGQIPLQVLLDIHKIAKEEGAKRKPKNRHKKRSAKKPKKKSKKLRKKKTRKKSRKRA